MNEIERIISSLVTQGGLNRSIENDLRQFYELSYASQEQKIEKLNARTVSVEDFGTIGGAVTANLGGTFSLQKDSSTKVETAVNQNFTSKGITIQGDNSELWTGETNDIFNFNVTPARTVRITAIEDALSNISEPLMSKITTQSEHQCDVGDVVFITGTTSVNVDDIDPVLTRKGDCTSVYKVISETEILVWRLAKTYDLTAVVNLNKPDAARINIRNVNLYRTIIGPTGLGWLTLAHISRAMRPLVENIIMKSVKSRGVTFESCFSPQLKNLYVSYADDGAHGSGSKSYGVFVHGSSYGIFDNIVSHNSRHVIDLQGNISAFAGYASFNLITNSIGFNNTSGAFSTHQGAHWNTFFNCKSYKSRQGFNVRGWGNIYDSCKSIKDYIGAQIINDQAAGGSKTGKILFKNSVFINPVANAIRISNNSLITDVTFQDCYIGINEESCSDGVIALSAPNSNTYIKNMVIDINGEIGENRVISLKNGNNLFVDRMTIRISDDAVLLNEYYIVLSNEDCKVEINSLEIIVSDPAKYPTNLIAVSSGKIITGFVRNVYMSGIKAGGKLHNRLADNQTFVNAFSHGPLQLGATTLTPV